MDKIPLGYCHCGCGQKTNLAKYNSPQYGWIKGEPVNFIKGHHWPNQYARENNPNWNGGKTSTGRYTRILMPEHPRANKANGYVAEHILIAEKALGKPLPLKAVVHHYTPDQLVICQDNSYHFLLHQRQRALEACGHASWRKCTFCKQYDDPKNMSNPNKPRRSSYHRSCNAMKTRERRLGWGGRTAPRRFVVASP